MMNFPSYKSIDQFLTDEVCAHQIPGAVYAVINRQSTLAENAIGYTHKDEKIPMALDTLFDLASLTKVCATLPSLLLLLEQGKLDIDDPVQLFFPDEANSDLTLRDLLTHTSGFPASVPFYQYGWSKQEVLRYILSLNTLTGKQVVYSDLNFILLGFLVERLTGQSIDVFADGHVFQPLGMTSTGFNPKADLRMIAPTEWMPKVGHYQWGKVHDENAFYFGGVSGHAGLFSNLHDLKIYVRMLMNEGRTDSGAYFLSPATLRMSRRNYTKSLGKNRGIGWQLVDDRFSPGGYFVSKESYGHTGFTGPFFWIDPVANLGFILLSNRVHISRQINMNRIRRIFVNLAMKEWTEQDKTV
ncbi:serine hydrolase [Sporolactobacillus sp. Y61]|uniref:Serine hydrolase n=1 Tax=Sporolactobacillus sp. Y61 TaxID=3160863 RepID=A0AAU8IEK4_9BACL